MRCAIYIRISKECAEQKTSLQNQKDLFINYVAEKNWDIYDFYIDIKSASKPLERKNLERMINDGKQKRYDIILSKELSRLARNGKRSYEIRDTALQNNIYIITLDGAINTLTGDISKFGLYVWLYENEAQTIADRIKYSLNSKAHRGEFKSGTPPYGYHLENGKLIKNSDETPQVVQRIFSEYLSGKGYDEIAKGLFTDKIITPSQYFGKSNASNIWHGATVRGIIKNANYTGDLVQSKTQTQSVTSLKRIINDPKDYIIIENCHEAIIDKKTFELANALLNSRKKIKPKPQKHLFSNLLFCADCGKGMHFKKNRKGYVCGSFDKRGKVACESHIVREKNLIEIISNEFKIISASIDNIDYLNKIQLSLQKESKKKVKLINKYTNKIENFKMQKNKTLKLLLNDTISQDDYSCFTEEINKEIEKYTLEKNKLQLELETNKNSTDISNLKEIQSHIKDFSELTPELLNRFIEKIEIKKDGSPKIYYRFSEASIYFSDLINFTQVSTCGVCGNISISKVFSTSYPFTSRASKSVTRLFGLHET